MDEQLSSSMTIGLPVALEELGNEVVLQIGAVYVWEQVRKFVIVPILRLALIICLIMSLMLFAERVYMGIVILFVKLLRRKPEKRYKWERIDGDLELGRSAYPMILVQIPMFNEKEVRNFLYIFFTSCFFFVFLNNLTEFMGVLPGI